MNSLLNFVPNISDSIRNINRISTVKNVSDIFEKDDNKSKLAINKLNCISRYRSLSFKTVFFTILLPIILLFIMITFDIKNFTIFKVLGSWLFLGFITTILLNTFYLPYKKLKINTSVNINKDTCESI